MIESTGLKNVTNVSSDGIAMYLLRTTRFVVFPIGLQGDNGRCYRRD